MVGSADSQGESGPRSPRSRVVLKKFSGGLCYKAVVRYFSEISLDSLDSLDEPAWLLGSAGPSSLAWSKVTLDGVAQKKKLSACFSVASLSVAEGATTSSSSPSNNESKSTIGIWTASESSSSC